jgi:hypothetical protein
VGLGIASVQNILELHNLGYLKNSNSVIEIGSQELHLKKEDLKELFEYAGLKSDLIDEYPNINNWPFSPRTSSKHFYKTLGIKEYQSIDISGLLDAIPHDLNKPFEDRSKFNSFDIVTDYGSCEHVFNVAECYRAMHNLTKPGGYIIVAQQTFKGNSYFKFDESFFEGIAAANGYKIIFNSYVITPGDKTKSGSLYQFHIPRNQKLLNVLDYSKLNTTERVTEIGIYGVLQKIKEDEFKMPYQNNLMKDVYNISGFNRMYMREPMSYTFITSATKTLEETSISPTVASLTLIIKALFKWFKTKIRRIIRIK